MKVFAVVPALLVLVSLCGSPVPPPPGTVSGSVYYDANRNSIRDSCDSPMVNTQVVVNGPEGKSASTRTDKSGAFAIDDAPVGDGLVTLFTGEGLVWPITTAPQAVRVESSKEVGGVEIGSASRAVYDANSVTVSGVIFEDENANGTVDKDECSLISQANAVSVSAGQRIAVVSAGTYELKNMPADPGLTVTVEYGLYGSVVAFGGDPSRPLTPTNGSSGDTLCSVVVTPRLRYGPKTYEANIGFAPAAPGAGIVTGIVFDDENENGEREAGEDGVSDVPLSIVSVDSGCGDSRKANSLVTDSTGAFLLGSLSPGAYSPQLGSFVLDSDTVMSSDWSDTPAISIKRGETTHVDLPVRLSPAASVRVVVFDDDNGNGEHDSGETLISDTSVCASARGPMAGYSYTGSGQYNSPALELGLGYPACFSTDANGRANLSPLPAGDYELSVESGPTMSFAEKRPAIALSLAVGQHVDVNLPVTIPSPDEQVIHPGFGDTVRLDVCYADSAWVQPDFDSRWALVREQLVIDDPTARLIYEHGIYNSAYGEMYAWSTISGFSFEQTPVECNKPTGYVYFMVGYAPLDTVRSGNVTQIRVRRSDKGLIAVMSPDSYENDAPVQLIVDENYVPIVRCGGYYGCEWNDGTTPNYYSGGYGYGTQY